MCFPYILLVRKVVDLLGRVVNEKQHKTQKVFVAKYLDNIPWPLLHCQEIR